MFLRSDDPEAVYSFYENFYNPYDGLLYFAGVNGVRIKYKLNGEYVGKMKVPFGGESPEVIVPLDSATFCAFFSNRNGKEKKRIVLFDNIGDVKKEYPNPRPIYNLVSSAHEYKKVSIHLLFLKEYISLCGIIYSSDVSLELWDSEP